MKMVELAPVAKPASFTVVKFTVAEYEAAVKRGKIMMPYATAMENVANSRGLYEIVAEKSPDMHVKVNGLTIDDMSGPELKMFCLRMGVTIRKKTIRLSELRQLAKEKMGEITVVDDEDVEGDGEDAE